MDLKEAAESKGARHYWEKARLHIVKRMLKKILPANRQSVGVLDLGCGDLYVASNLNSAFQVPVLAVDNAFTDSQIAQATEIYANSEIWVARTIEELPETGRPISHVLLLDVIEHVADDTALLTMLHNSPRLCAGAFVLITVPAFQSVFSAHDVYLGHYRRYTRKKLLSTVRKAGFEPGRSGYFFLSLLFARALKRLLCPEKKAQSELTQGTVSPLLSALLAGMLKIDYFVGVFFRNLGIYLPGLSTFVICRKPAS